MESAGISVDVPSEVISIVENEIDILKTALHQINVEGKECKKIEMTGDLSDLNEYLKNLLSEMHKKTERRSYKFERDTTEFHQAMLFFAQHNDLEMDRCDALAKRLLAQEVKTEERYSQLASKKDGSLVHKGSFLQFLYKDENGLGYLGVKLEHQTFVDEQDFKKRSGLPDVSKVYKACQVFFDGEGKPLQVHAYDSNAKPANYWWKDFLELEVVRNDEHNTTAAVKAVVRVVGGLKKEFPHDYTTLRNAVVAAFKKTGRLNYDQFVNSVFSSYEPYDPGLKDKLPSFIDKLKLLPGKCGFDTQFELVPAAVDLRRTKIDLTSEISISYESDIKDFDDKIWAEQTKEGKKLVVINSDDAFACFRLKERV